MKTLKTAAAAAAAALTLICACGIPALAADRTSVRVSVADGNGRLVLAQEEVAVTDSDGDGALTVNDALFAAHEAKYPGGAAAGYSSSKGAYGLAVSKLWGCENGTGYGYYVNNAAAMNLTDAVRDGDYISAFVYTDTEKLSDMYVYFNAFTAEAEAGKPFTLTLSGAGYDAEWNPVTVPVEGAVITIDGEVTEFVTDAEGRAVITADAEKTCVISAFSPSGIIVPPVCKVTVRAADAEAAPAPTGGRSPLRATAAALAAASAAALAVLPAMPGKKNER